MRPLRTLLAAAAIAAAASTPSSAAPPVGCYGFPTIPSAFLCVVSFTPGNAVPGASVDPDDSTVTIPPFCAGDCYGPFTVPVPGVDFASGSGQIAVIVYNGQTYVVGTGGGIPPIPPLPPVGIPPIPPLPTFPNCPGSPVTGRQTSPYVCAHRSYGTYYVGTCIGTECTIFEIPLSEIGDALQELLDDPICRPSPTC